MQIPAQEDRNSKRIREEGSYAAETTTETKFKLMHRNKPKLNPVNEEVEKIEVIDRDTVVKDNVPPTVSKETYQRSTSNTQMIQKQHNVEVSSSSKPTKKELEIKKKYTEIKLRNEILKANTYTQYWK